MTAEMDLVIEKLNNIEKTGDKTLKLAEGNDRALRGYNNHTGLVGKVDKMADDVQGIPAQKEAMNGKFLVIHETLHGKGHESIGVIGEQVLMKRIAKWILGASTGLIVSTIALLIKLALTASQATP